MTTPEAGLILAYWAHMLAAAAWMGGLAVLTLVILPGSRRSLDAGGQAQLIARIHGRLDRLGWFALIILIFSGLVQMSASAQYDGFLTFTNRWSVAILLKHIVFALIIGLSAWQTWGVIPGLARAAFKLSKGMDAPEQARLEKANVTLVWINLALGVIVLALTALARISA